MFAGFPLDWRGVGGVPDVSQPEMWGEVHLGAVMTLIRVAAAVLAALVMLAPLVAAGDAGDASTNETKDTDEDAARSDEPEGPAPDDGANATEEGGDAAWVEDCPPDKMCAMSGPEPSSPPPDENRTADGDGECLNCPTSHDATEDGAGDGPRYKPEPQPGTESDDTMFGTEPEAGGSDRRDSEGGAGDCPPGLVCALAGPEAQSGMTESTPDEGAEPFAGLAVLAAGLLSMGAVVAGHRVRL